MITLRDFDSYADRVRMWCSAGHRLFNLMPDGSVTRCVAMYYVNQTAIGRIDDESFFDGVKSGKNTHSPCEKGYCIEVCDACYSEQGIIDGDRIIEHAGHDVLAMNGADYCMLQVHLTGKCNYRCEYCCAEWWMREARKKSLPVEKWVFAADQFTKIFSTGAVTLMGGEPLVSEAFVPMTRVFLQSGWKVQVVTNYSLPRVVEDVCRNLPGHLSRLMRVQVSLHLTHKGFDLDSIISNLVRMRNEYGVQFAASIVATNENMEACRAGNVEQRMRDAGAMWFTVLPNRP